jgi:hypothetical protein
MSFWFPELRVSSPARLFHPEGFALSNDEDVVMQQPVEQAGGC